MASHQSSLLYKQNLSVLTYLSQSGTTKYPDFSLNVSLDQVLRLSCKVRTKRKVISLSHHKHTGVSHKKMF